MWDTDKIEKALGQLGVSFQKDEPLSKHTSFKIGGPAAFFCTPDTPQGLYACMELAREAQMPCFILGKGSNVLFRDEGYAGMILCPSGGLFSEITVFAEGLSAGAAVPLSALCKKALEQEFGGLSFAYGIPGGVGGAVYMNAGAYGGEISDVLKSVTYLDEKGNVVTALAEKLKLGYRSSLFQEKKWVILSAVFQLTKQNAELIRQQMDENMRKREEKQPLHLPSAGSAFKRPKGAFAGALIEQCGLKGYRVGDAAISEKHCGFIVNLGSATCADILALATHVSDTVKAQTGYVLEKEIRVIENE